MKYILSVKTLYDNNNRLTYVITKYNDNSAAVKIYKKEFESNNDKYLKTLKLNSLLNM
jgi:hypothetical protein